MAKTRTCGVCGQRLEPDEDRCPFCGGRPRGHGWTWWLLIFILIIGAAGAYVAWRIHEAQKPAPAFYITDDFARRVQEYTALQPFSDGLAAVRDRYGKWGYIDHAGNEAIAPAFSHAAPFNAGVAQVKIGRRIAYIDKQGNEVDGVHRRAYGGVNSGYRVYVSDADMLMGIVDSVGRTVIPARYDSITHVSEDLAVAVLVYDSLPGTPDIQAALYERVPELTDDNLESRVPFVTDSAIIARTVHKRYYGYVDMTGATTFAPGLEDKVITQRRLMHEWRERNDMLRRLEDERLRRLEALRQQEMLDSLEMAIEAEIQ